MEPVTRRRVLASSVVSVTALAGCSEESSPTTPTDTTSGETPGGQPNDDGGDSTAQGDESGDADGDPREAAVSAVSVVQELEVPWDLTFGGDAAFVSERDGGIRQFDAAALATDSGLTPADSTEVLAATDLPDRTGPGEGGTLGVTTHPDYPEPPIVYVYYTAEDDLRNRVIRYNLESEALAPVIDDIPAAQIHNGGRITVGPDGYLWVLTGDADDGGNAQDPSNLAGATLRVTLDGDPAPDNPSFDEDSDNRLYTIGHRNLQGIGFTPGGDVVVTEHGPAARDEVNRLQPGGNYGWDIARGGPDDDDYDSYTDHDEFTPPLINTGPTTTWAPSGATYYTNDAISAWQNRLFAAGLRSTTLYCVTLTRDGETPPGGTTFDAAWLDDQYTATAHEFYAGEYGRLRHIEAGPNGGLYLLTSNRGGRAEGEFPVEADDQIIRLEPS